MAGSHRQGPGSLPESCDVIRLKDVVHIFEKFARILWGAGVGKTPGLDFWEESAGMAQLGAPKDIGH